MAVRFSDEQVIQATSGKRIQVSARASYGAVCTDTRALVPGCLFVALVGERFDGHAFLEAAAAGGAGAAVVQAGRSRPPLPKGFGLFEVTSTLEALGGLARYHRQRFKRPVGAVTGSNGKTTTKEMVGAILATRGPALRTEGNLNNEVGVPLTLFRLEPSHVAAVIEMGMNHPGEIARLTSIAEPDAGLITCVQPAHLAGLGSLSGVAAAKGELFAGLRPGATAVVNADEPLLLEQARLTQARVLTFGYAEGAAVQIIDVARRGRAGLIAILRYLGTEYAAHLSFVGEHNALNAAGAFALAIALGYRPEECLEGLKAARPQERRLNVLEAPGGVTVLDDCYNANPGSMRAALETLAALAGTGRAVAVLGDMLELGEEAAAQHRALGALAARHARLAAFFGPLSGEAAKEAGMGETAAHFTEVESLLAWLTPRLEAGDVVLVKGSRGMRLERVVQALTGQAGGGHS